MSTISVTLPDGSQREIPQGSTALDVATAIGSRLAKAAIAAVVNGELVDLGREVPDNSSVSVVTTTSAEGREVLRHSTAHVLAQAVTRLWPGAHFAIGPAITDGFYYDFDLPGGAHFSDSDMLRIEEEMRRIVAENQPFIRSEHSIEEGLALFSSQPYKTEIIAAVQAGGSAEDLAEVGNSAVVSAYRNTEDFVDLCRGPHVPSTGRLGYFKLMRVAGAYWRGDEKRQQLQRIYGTAWESQEALDAHLYRLEEAEKRDHRKLGLEMDLFSFPSEIGPGLSVFHPKGGALRRLIEDYSRQRHVEDDYEFVSSPHITKAELFETSGHLQWYADGMYPPMILDEGQRYYLKPMNCPYHIMIYKSHLRSYRDLPIRYGELGTVYRYERTGVLHGLLRVRGFTQDDAHLFCRPDQIQDEVSRVLDFTFFVLKSFGFVDFEIFLSTRPEKSVGSDDKWVLATSSLEGALKSRGIAFHLDEGGGAFYGPKIDIKIKDALGRSWQCSTIQVDFNNPERFELSYIGVDGKSHQPIMIHRALMGSIERFFGILVEHFGGAFPTWLAPVQAVVMAITDNQREYVNSVVAQLRAAGFRADADLRNEKIGFKIREAEKAKIPYMLVAGDREVQSGMLSVRGRSGANLGNMTGAAVIDLLRNDVTRAQPELQPTH